MLSTGAWFRQTQPAARIFTPECDDTNDFPRANITLYTELSNLGFHGLPFTSPPLSLPIPLAWFIFYEPV